MPELPEVETMVRGIREVCVGAQLRDLRPCQCDCRPIQMSPAVERMRELSRGARIDAVDRIAKRILLRLQSGLAFVIEPRMTGLMLVDAPPDREHLRLEWRLARGRARASVWFWDRRGLGTVRLLDAEEIETALGATRIGPDPLTLSAAEWRDRLSRTSREIKTALLDQKLVAGIGNLYASEILHRAGIHPTARADRLAPARVARLQAAAVLILNEAIRYEGSTLGDGTYRNALNQNGGYQKMHQVYARQGETCPRCRRAAIRRIVQAQRSTFYCPRCQR